jgi:SAM-dependent methyltransferase
LQSIEARRRFYDTRYAEKRNGSIPRVGLLREIDNRFYQGLLWREGGRAVGRLVDVGAGRGRHLRHWPGPAVAIDLSWVALTAASAPRCVADAAALPLREGSCGCVTCIEVLEHLPAPESARALLEIHRILEPGGLALVSVPNRAASTTRPLRRMNHLFADAGHLQAFDVPTLAAVLRGAHFTVMTCHAAGHFTLALLLKLERSRLVKRGLRPAGRILPLRRLIGFAWLLLLRLEERLLRRLPGFRLLAVARKP